MEKRSTLQRERLILEKVETKKKRREKMFSRSRDLREDRGVRQRISGHRR